MLQSFGLMTEKVSYYSFVCSSVLLCHLYLSFPCLILIFEQVLSRKFNLISASSYFGLVEFLGHAVNQPLPHTQIYTIFKRGPFLQVYFMFNFDDKW